MTGDYLFWCKTEVFFKPGLPPYLSPGLYLYFGQISSTTPVLTHRFQSWDQGRGNSSNFAANNQSISNLPCWCFCVVRFQAHRCIQFLTRISLMQPVHWQNATFHYLDRAAVQPALPWTYRHPFLFYVCLPLWPLAGHWHMVCTFWTDWLQTEPWHPCQNVHTPCDCNFILFCCSWIHSLFHIFWQIWHWFVPIL